MLKKLTVLCVSVFFVLVMGLYTYSIAGSEKGLKKCSDNIDNDDDGLIDGDDPDCGGDGGSGGIGVLLDATGATIDKVVSITAGGPKVAILFEVSGHTVGATIVGEILNTRLAGFQTSGKVFFDDVDCNGQAWIEENSVVGTSFFDEFRSASIVSSINIGDERRLYVPTGVVSPSTTVDSVMDDNCANRTETRDLVPATLLDADLHITYPKPYTLRLN